MAEMSVHVNIVFTCVTSLHINVIPGLRLLSVGHTSYVIVRHTHWPSQCASHPSRVFSVRHTHWMFECASHPWRVVACITSHQCASHPRGVPTCVSEADYPPVTSSLQAAVASNCEIGWVEITEHYVTFVRLPFLNLPSWFRLMAAGDRVVQWMPAGC